MNFYPRYVGDIMRDTSKMTLLEYGIFNRLLDQYYASEQPFTLNDAINIVRPINKVERAAITTVLNTLFVKTEAGYINEVALNYIEEYQKKSKAASKSAKKRWNANAMRKGMPNECETDANGNANAMRTHSERNANAMLTNNQYPITKRDSVESLSLIPNVGRKGPVPVSRLLKGVVSDD